MSIKNRDKLLADIAEGLRNYRNPSHPLGCIEVRFICASPDSEEEERYSFDLAGALDVLANDLFFDERGNWSDAKSAEVLSF